MASHVHQKEREGVPPRGGLPGQLAAVRWKSPWPGLPGPAALQRSPLAPDASRAARRQRAAPRRPAAVLGYFLRLGAGRDLCLCRGAPQPQHFLTPARGCPQVGACSLATPGPSPADGAADAPSPALRGPDGPHRARLSPVAGKDSGTMTLCATRPGRSVRGRARYVSRSSSAAVVRKPGVCPGVGCWRERMPGSDGHTLRWAIAPGMLGISQRS